MIDELKSRFGALENGLKSWSLSTDAEVEALCENLIEVERHIRSQKFLLGQKEKQISDLAQENSELKSMMCDLLQITEELLKIGAQTWVSDLKEKCAALIDAATEVEVVSADAVAAGQSGTKAITGEVMNKSDHGGAGLQSIAGASNKTSLTGGTKADTPFAGEDSEVVYQARNALIVTDQKCDPLPAFTGDEPESQTSAYSEEDRGEATSSRTATDGRSSDAFPAIHPDRQETTEALTAEVETPYACILDEIMLRVGRLLEEGDSNSLPDSGEEPVIEDLEDSASKDLTAKVAVGEGIA